MRRFLRYGAVFLVLGMIMCLAAAVPALAVSVPNLSPAAGGPGITVIVSGTGTASESININFDSGPVGSTTVAGGGTWSTTFVVPSAIAGPHAVVAVGTTSGTSGAANFTIVPKITATQSTGNTLILNGSGFANGDIVTIQIDSVAVGSAVQAGITGSWGPVTANAAAGAHTITASGSGGSATSNVTVISNPTISLSRPNGTVGASITVTGNGFGINEQGITVNFDGVAIGQSTSAGATGTWTTTFVVPSVTSGTSHSVTSFGATTLSVPAQSFSILPSFALSKNSGPAGTSVTATGSGFGSSETNIQLSFDNTPIGSPTTAGSNGTWTATFPVPATQGGAHSIGVSGSSTSSIAPLTFNVGAGISINKNSGPAGTSVNVTGSGFAASETNVIVTFDGAPQGSPATASATGAWTATFTVPAAAGGSHSIGASGSSTTAASTATVNFTVGAGISLNKTNGAAGTSVTVTGSGFVAGESNVNVTFDGTPIGSPTQASSTGAWTATFTVPAAQGGTHAVGAFGSTTQASTVQVVNYTMGAGIAINKTSGAAGTIVTVTGSGFGAGENGITVTYDGNPIGSPLSASPTGGWTSNITVPFSAAGQHTFGAGSQQTPNAGSASFKVTPAIAFNTTSGFVGASVTVSGSGFAANSAIQITYDGNAINTNGTVTTDASGNFSKTIVIPKSLAGAHSVKVVDAQGNGGDASFSISNTPPPIPNPVSPSDGQKVGLFGGATPEFRWSAVSTPSSVTYRLQIDTDSDFPHPLLDVKDIATTHYTLPQAQALDSGQYYWRVQAIDAASNVSDWSQPVALQSGIMSMGVFVLLVVVVLAAFGAVIYMLLIRPRRKKKAVPAPAVPAPVPSSAPEITMPDVVDAEYRTIDSSSEDTTKRRALPWRLALPQAPQEPKTGKTLSPEDRARLKVIIDFAKSLPLIESGNNTNWLIELAENGSGAAVSLALYGQLLRGELQVKYEPAWMRHPIFMDLQILLEGQPILEDLNAFIDSVNNAASKDVLLLQDIYKDATAESDMDILANGGWGFVAGVYTDALSWYLGKSLRDPSERDYAIKSEGNASEATGNWALYGEQNTAFAGLLVRAADEKEASQLRALHLKLRRAFRNNDKAGEVASLTTQLDARRGKLLADFSQFNRLNP
jgi:hypothetical protein